MSDEGENIHARTECNPIATAPKDGTLLRLRMDYSGDGDSNALWDTADFAWTIGFNQFDHTGDDTWQYAGWDWNGDEFEKGYGATPIGWLPFHAENSTEQAIGSIVELGLKFDARAKYANEQADTARRSGNTALAETYRSGARTAERKADTLRDAISVLRGAIGS